MCKQVAQATVRWVQRLRVDDTDGTGRVGRYGRIVAGVALTTFFIWLAFRNVDLRAVGTALQQAQYRYLWPAMLCGLLGYSLRTWRWGLILSKTKQIPFARLFPMLMIGFATNNLLPARVGEFVRAYVLSRQEGISPSLALATLVVERVCDGLTLITLMTVTLLAFPLPIADPQLAVVELAATVIFGLATVALIMLLIAPQLIIRLVRILLRPFPTALTVRVLDLLEQFVAGLAALRSPLVLLKLAGTSLLVWLCEGAIFGFVLLAFPLGLSWRNWFVAAVFLLVFVNLGIMIPSAPGYIGTYQFFAKLALGAFAISGATAVALSLVAHALQYTFITLVGLFSLWRLGLSPRNLGQMAHAEQEAVVHHDRMVPKVAK